MTFCLTLDCPYASGFDIIVMDVMFGILLMES